MSGINILVLFRFPTYTRVGRQETYNAWSVFWFLYLPFKSEQFRLICIACTQWLPQLQCAMYHGRYFPCNVVISNYVTTTSTFRLPLNLWLHWELGTCPMAHLHDIPLDCLSLLQFLPSFCSVSYLSAVSISYPEFY